jgi:hypothetical protein
MGFPTFFRACLAMAGCAALACTKVSTFRPSEDFVSYGVYTAKSQEAGGVTVKLNLNQNNTYSKRRFQGTCLLMENNGKWESGQEYLEFRLREIRRRESCDASWQVEKVDKTARRTIRNITTRAFDMLEEGEATEAEWIKFTKG